MANIFRKIGDGLRELQGTRRCPTEAELLAYMRQKQGKKKEAFDFLQYWVSMRCWYRSDSKPGDNWRPLAQILAKDKDGNMGDDCEGMSTIKKAVVNGLGWGQAVHLGVTAADSVMGPERLPWCHAACLVYNPQPTRSGLLLLDYTMARGNTIEEMVQAMGRAHRVKPTEYFICSDDGYVIGHKVQI